ncbi:MAG TPA: tetratricopeptide repeat protein [Armatimonadetes bacterium]|nr:tetratricopeptide repeat protein [Armatimonadota bacterium]
MYRAKHLLGLGAIFILGGLLTGRGGTKGPDPFGMFSAEDADRAVEERLGPVVPNERLERLGQRIARYTHVERDFRFTFREIRTAKVNAFSLPNGSTYVTTGLLNLVGDNDDELAFALAHEMAHVALRHAEANRQLQRALQDLAAQGDQKALPRALLESLDRSLTRQQEYDADRYGMLYLARMGYPPMAAIRFLRRLKEAGLDYTPILARNTDHPTTGDRIAAAFRTQADIVDVMNKFDFGLMYLMQEKYAEAAEMFEGFLRHFSDNKAAWNNLGLAYYHLAIRDLPLSRYALADAVVEFETSFVLRGEERIDPELYARAREALEEALRLDPTFAEAYSNLGNLFFMAGEYDQASHAYRAALLHKPHFAAAVTNYGAFLATRTPKGQPVSEEAWAFLQQAVKDDPNLPEAHYNLALAAESRGEKQIAKEAWATFLTLQKKGPRIAIAREHLARLDPQRVPPAEAPQGPAAAEERLGEIKIGDPADNVRDKHGDPEKEGRGPGRAVVLWEYPTKGLTVELKLARVRRVVAGPPAFGKLGTSAGVTVGEPVKRLLEVYGRATAVSKQRPYDIWLYPARGLGFFIAAEEVDKIFVYEPRP